MKRTGMATGVGGGVGVGDVGDGAGVERTERTWASETTTSS